MARYEIVMEKLSLTMEKGTIIRWIKKEGDAVNKGDALAEVATDKVNMSIESPYEGVLAKVLVKADDTVAVMTPVAYIEGREGQMSFASAGDASESPSEKQEAPKAKPLAAETGLPKEEVMVMASPAAKKLAATLGIDLSQIKGTGPGGRIVTEDVEAYQSVQPKMTSVAKNMAAAAGIDVAAIKSEGKIYKEQVINALSKDMTGDKKVSLSNIQETMAKRMVESWTHAPHVTYHRAIDMSHARAFRKALTDRGFNVSYIDILIKANALTLGEMPIVNSSFYPDGIVYHEDKNIGIATDTENGLLVPVVKDCLNKSLAQIAAESKEVINKARTGTVSLNDIKGGTFTISNLGMMGIEYFSPIINPPESAILGVCAIIEKPVVENGQVVVKPMMNVCLSCDHRHVDGATAARYLQKLAWYLENPYFVG